MKKLLLGLELLQEGEEAEVVAAAGDEEEVAEGDEVVAAAGDEEEVAASDEEEVAEGE